MKSKPCERYPVSIRSPRHALLQSDLKARASSSGLHLFNRRTGFNVLFDEIRIPPNLWAPAPRQVSVALTNACDLTCPFCYAPKIRGSIDFSRLVGWLEELDANGCLGVGLGGGEPTLYRHFVEVCEHAAKKTCLAVTFTTHSHHIDVALAAQLRGIVHFVRVSMDGVGDTYEELRGRPFASLRSRLEIVRSLAPFGINFVVNGRTLPDLDAAIELAAEAGASEFLLLPQHQVGGIVGVDAGLLAALHRWVRSYRGPVPLTISESDALGLPKWWAIGNEDGLRAYAHIDALGVVKRSSYDTEGISIGPEGVMRALNLLQTPSGEVRR